MHIGRIAGANHKFGKPEGWNTEEQGVCASLHVRAERTAAGIEMTSAWFPTPEEIQKIIRGAPIYLTVIGQTHPPVRLTVGDATHK